MCWMFSRLHGLPGLRLLARNRSSVQPHRQDGGESGESEDEEDDEDPNGSLKMPPESAHWLANIWMLVCPGVLRCCETHNS